MPQRSRITWLPILLGLYLLAIIAYIALTRGATLVAEHPAYPLTLVAEHPAYPLTLVVVAVGAIIAIVVALVRARHG